VQNPVQFLAVLEEAVCVDYVERRGPHTRERMEGLWNSKMQSNETALLIPKREYLAACLLISARLSSRKWSNCLACFSQTSPPQGSDKRKRGAVRNEYLALCWINDIPLDRQ
jgi:hypothetical protein